MMSYKLTRSANQWTLLLVILPELSWVKIVYPLINTTSLLLAKSSHIHSPDAFNVNFLIVVMLLLMMRWLLIWGWIFFTLKRILQCKIDQSWPKKVIRVHFFTKEYTFSNGNDLLRRLHSLLAMCWLIF